MWLKLHSMGGVTTNIVTSVEVSERYAMTNLCVVIQSVHELGIETNFEAETLVTA